MNRIVIPFDKEDISVDELKEHIDYYVELANKGEELIWSGDKKEARDILRKINKQLSKEYHYYEKTNVSEIIDEKELYRCYYWAVVEAYAKQNNKNSYDCLDSNFYDIKNYLKYHMAGRFLKI